MMETTESATPVDRIVILLERIAATLERLAPAVPGASTKEKTDDEKWQDELDERIRCRQWASDNGLKDTRAVKAIGRAGISSFEMITEYRLRGTRNCGPKTIATILEWKDRVAK